MNFQSTTVLLLVFPVVASAHHARVYFSDDVLEIEGELASIMWRNPHPEFTVNVRSPTGEDEVWRLEGSGSLYRLQRAGVTRATFEIGQRIRVVGQVSTRAERELLATNILLPSGTEAVLRPGPLSNRYWAEAESAVGIEEESFYDAVAAARENRGIFRVWSPPPPGNSISIHTPFTQAAIEGRSSWDPLDNFAMRCERPGLPIVMRNPHPYEFIDNGNEITLRGETWDIERTIHMEGNPEGQPATPLGYSVGRWEDNVLVVQTTRINWPYFDNIGTRQSEAVEMIERFTVSEDQTRLDYHLTINDLATFTEPATYERFWLALGETLPTYDCRVNLAFE